MNISDNPPEITPNILIIGAYGLIGSGIARRLLADGYNVRGLGRNPDTAKRVLRDVPCISKDVSTLCDADDWTSLLGDVSVVVNCSGALQDGLQDDLEAVHHHAVAALASACASADIALVQISAVGAALDASTPFLSSKARGDAAIRSSGVRYHIFRPGLVLAPHAYGGTTMLRMLAAFPLVQPIAMPQARIQTVSLADLAHAVSAAIGERIPAGYEADLVETEFHSLRDVVASMRCWLGFGTAKREFAVPAPAVWIICKLADAVSLLGWRSPLRTTAFKVLAEGVGGKPVDLTPFGLPPTSTMSQTLAAMPARAEDRLFARMALLTPVMVTGLCLFWLASGLISLVRVNEAALVLETAGWSHALATGSVVFWAIVDIIIAAAFALRRFAAPACWAAIGVSIFYLLASTMFVPGLWLDPLGPLVKIIPVILLALVTRAALETR